MLRLSPGTVFTNDVVQPPYFPVDRNKTTKESFPLILPSFSPTRRDTGGKSVGKNVFKRGGGGGGGGERRKKREL